MAGLEGIGKILLIVGIVLAVLGVVLAFSGRIPFLGRLPGDILIKRDGVSFYFPIVTFLLLSVGLTLIINFILRFIRQIASNNLKVDFSPLYLISWTKPNRNCRGA